MPVQVAQGHIVQVLAQGVIENQLVENVWYFRAVRPDPDMVANLLQAIATCLVTSLLPVLSDAYALEQLVGTVVSPAVGAQAEYQVLPEDAQGGESESDSAPSFVSALVSLRTTRAGRKGRGRIYICGVPESDTTRSSITAGSPLQQGLIAFLACMLAKFTIKDVPQPGEYEWGVMSRSIGGLKPPFLTDGFAPITQATPRMSLSTTRSRKVKEATWRT